MYLFVQIALYVSVGIWSLGAAKKEQACSPLPYSSLENGRIAALSRQRFLFHCDRGYFLAGREEIRCFRGKWTFSRQPKCYRSEGQCDDPPPIPNGDVLGEDRNVGAALQYICHSGYVLLGKDRRTCTAANEWSGLTPSCMEESEPLQHIAERLEKQFVKKMEAHSTDSIGQARLLDGSTTREGLDLVVLLDRSSSVDPVDFETGKDFIKFLFEEFGIRNGDAPTSGTRAAVITFGSTVDLVFNINNASITDKFAANRALDEVQPGGGGTALEPALTSVFLNVEPHLRQRAKKALFIITDGEPNIGSADVTPQYMAKQLEMHEDFEIFTVGIGKDVNRQLLSEIASEPPLSHVFVLDRYSDLHGIMTIIRDRPTEAPPISPDKCGYVDNDLPTPKMWPWAAAIYISVPKPPETSEGELNETAKVSTRLILCGGTLVCSQWVLTSASCFYDPENSSAPLVTQELFVVLGEDDITKVDENQTNFYTTSAVLHPSFDPLKPGHHNLALLKLHEPAPVPKYRPACLPPRGKRIPMHLDLNTNTSVTGWGLPQQKKQSTGLHGGTARLKAAVKVLALAEEDECRRFTADSPQDTFCAGFGSVSTCVGNQGSALIAVDPATGLNHVLGVLSMRSKCHLGHSQFTELTKYVRWIDDVTSSCHVRHLV